MLYLRINFCQSLKHKKKGIKTKVELKFSSLWIDGRSKYISLTLKKFYKKKGVVIKSILFYTFK